MEPLPSKVGLFIGRVCNCISVVLVIFGLTAFTTLSLPKWAAYGIGILLTTFTLVMLVLSYVSSQAQWERIFRRSVETNPALKRQLPNHWQWSWMQRSYTFGLKKGEEWRVTQAIVLTFLALLGVSALEAWKYPDFAPKWSSVWIVWLPMSCLVGSMCHLFGVGFAQPNRPDFPRNDPPDGFPYDDDDPDGPAGIGARPRTPTPVLTAGNHYPDNQRYG